MKISQLIQKLQESQEQYGDIDVCFPDFGNLYIDIERVVPEYPWKDGDTFVKDTEAGITFVCLK